MATTRTVYTALVSCALKYKVPGKLQLDFGFESEVVGMGLLLDVAVAVLGDPSNVFSLAEVARRS